MEESKSAQPIREYYNGYGYTILNITVNEGFRVHAVVFEGNQQVQTISPLTNGDRDEAVEEVRLQAKHWIDQRLAQIAAG